MRGTGLSRRLLYLNFALLALVVAGALADPLRSLLLRCLVALGTISEGVATLPDLCKGL